MNTEGDGVVEPRARPRRSVRRLAIAALAALVVIATGAVLVAVVRPQRQVHVPGVACTDATGIELKFPCSPLTAGPMPEQPTSSANPWEMFSSSLYEGSSDENGVNERFTAVPNPAGRGVAIRNQKVDNDAEQHATIGTTRDLPLGSTSCSAFDWYVRDATEFPWPTGWMLIWQLQMRDSPIVAIEIADTSEDADSLRNEYVFRSRNGSDTGLLIPVAPITYGHWAFFVVCTYLANTGGWTSLWFAYDAWPDVSAAPTYSRTGIDTYQGDTGHNTIGIYSQQLPTDVSHYGYFDRYGRATGPQRAIALAGAP